MMDTDGAAIVLHQFRPAYDLQAYMRFTGITYHVENEAYAEFASTGELPQLAHGKVCVGWRKAIKYLKNLHRDKEESVPAEQRADAVAYSALLQGPLRDALLYYHWADEKRYETITRRLCRSAMLAPLSWFVPDMLRRKYCAYLEAAGWPDELSVKREATVCYEALEAKLLGGSPFLFGDKPTAVDALLYGHLAAAQYEPLGQVIAAHPRLVAFHSRVQSEYFPDDVAVSGVGYLATQGLNVFEAHEATLAAKAKGATGKNATKFGITAKQEGAASRGDDSSERYWRWGVLSVGAIMLGATVVLSRAAPTK